MAGRPGNTNLSSSNWPKYLLGITAFAVTWNKSTFTKAQSVWPARDSTRTWATHYFNVRGLRDTTVLGHMRRFPDSRRHRKVPACLTGQLGRCNYAYHLQCRGAKLHQKYRGEKSNQQQKELVRKRLLVKVSATWNQQGGLLVGADINGHTS